MTRIFNKPELRVILLIRGQKSGKYACAKKSVRAGASQRPSVGFTEVLNRRRFETTPKDWTNLAASRSRKETCPALSVWPRAATPLQVPDESPKPPPIRIKSTSNPHHILTISEELYGIIGCWRS